MDTITAFERFMHYARLECAHTKENFRLGEWIAEWHRLTKDDKQRYAVRGAWTFPKET